MHRFMMMGFLALFGCSTVTNIDRADPVSAALALPEGNRVITPVAHAESPTSPSVPKSLADFQAIALATHPRLAQVNWAVEAARGRAVQAGLYPNPTVAVNADEIGDRQGPGGIITAPQVNQEIVLGNKLGLSQAVAQKEVDRATLTVMAERFRILTDVRQKYWAVVSLQQRLKVLDELIAIADRSVVSVEQLKAAKEASDLDLVPLQVDRERYRAEREAANRSLPAARQALAAAVGRPDLTIASLEGQLTDAMPEFDITKLQAFVIAEHPLVRSAQFGVERARLAVSRAEAEPTPNVTLSTGYTRQNQNRSNDWLIGASVPVPLWNKNQGGIAAARAELGEAMNEVGRVQSELIGQVAMASEAYAAATARSESYVRTILPLAERNLELANKAFAGGEFDSLKVLQAQRAVGEARLEQVKALAERRQAAIDLAGWMLDDRWPHTQEKTP